MTSVKTYLWSKGIHKAAKGAVAAAVPLLAAKAGLLAKFGITVDWSVFETAIVAVLVGALTLGLNWLKVNKGWWLLALPLILAGRPAQAEGLQWDLPWGIGTVQLPDSGKDIMPLVGRDFVLNKTIAGLSTQVLTVAKSVEGYAGAVGDFQSQGPNIQPYLAIGANVRKYVPIIKQLSALQIHGFGRWDTTEGAVFKDHLGAGVAASYKF